MSPRHCKPETYERRISEVFSDRYVNRVKKTDRLFGFLLLFQWILGIVFAVAVSPRTWSGEYSETHVHIYAAILIGGLLASLPIYCILKKPGATLNRMIVAVSQISFSVLFIHLTGGRIETHFHVFGSLAFLASYRDVRVVLIATAITAIDHLMRGFFWPQSVYGVLTATPWRALEHAAWVAFEDLILIYSIKLALAELRFTSESHVRLEDKSEQLSDERNQVKLLLDIAVIANESQTPDEGMKQALRLVCQHSRWPAGRAYVASGNDSSALTPMGFWHLPESERFQAYRGPLNEGNPSRPTIGLAGQVLKTGNPIWIEDAAQDQSFLVRGLSDALVIRSAFAFPIVAFGKTVAVLEFISDEVINKDNALFSTASHIGRQVGQVFERKKANDDLRRAHDEIVQFNHSLEEKVDARTKALKESQQMVLSQQQTLLASAKMSALGEMAGEIAHEINTPLASIHTLSSQIEEVVKDDPLDRNLISNMASQVVTTSDRIAKIVQGLRIFSRDGSNDSFSAVDVKKLVDETLSFCHERFKSNGTKVQVSELEPSIRFDGRSIDISQVLLNLLNNAHDAIADLEEKWIKISVTEKENQIQIRVTDSGPGIPPEVRKKIFQPFFTTKGIGKGTGMGLSISLGLVRSHGGELKIDPECENTSFIICLPKIQPNKTRATAA
ncbi:MAG: ATP-binding protein [Bdellovibrionota bacterium]